MHSKRIVIKEKTLWTKTKVAVLAYFAKNNNKPATYTEIARAYVKSSYSNYLKACKELQTSGYLIQTSANKFKVAQSSWKEVKRGVETVERGIPYFSAYYNKVRKV